MPHRLSRGGMKADFLFAERGTTRALECNRPRVCSHSGIMEEVNITSPPPLIIQGGCKAPKEVTSAIMVCADERIAVAATPPEEEMKSPIVQNNSIDLARRAIVVEDEEEGVCPICLDCFGEADPGIPTTCRHHYHLQCIMQWAQRSRECPMCFKSLRLEDPDLSSLLPFGEYTPSARSPRPAALEAWELEQLLLRLADSAQRQERRARRREARRLAVEGAASAAPGGAGSSGSSRAAEPPGSRGSASSLVSCLVASLVESGAPSRPAWRGGGCGPGPSSEAGAARAGQPSQPLAICGGQARGGGPAAPGGGPAGCAASWPPRGATGSEAGSGSSCASVGSPREEGGSGTRGPAARTRLAALRLKESFAKATKELKAALFSPRGVGQERVAL